MTDRKRSLPAVEALTVPALACLLLFAASYACRRLPGLCAALGMSIGQVNTISWGCCALAGLLGSMSMLFFVRLLALWPEAMRQIKSDAPDAQARAPEVIPAVRIAPSSKTAGTVQEPTPAIRTRLPVSNHCLETIHPPVLRPGTDP